MKNISYPLSFDKTGGPMRYLALVISVIIAVFSLFQVQAEVPKLINYQGKLSTPQGAPFDTTVSMQFSIYPDSTGGTPLWTETQLSIRVDKGIFNTLLGSVTEIPDSVFTGAIRYLGVTVGNDPEIIPRKPIVSVGYAYSSDKLDGRHAGNNNGDVPVNNGNLNVNLNANYLDGYDAQTLMSPVKQVIRDTMWIDTFSGPNPRTKEFFPSINPNKAIVLLGQPDIYSYTSFRVFDLTSSTITIWCTKLSGAIQVIEYQIIEYK